MILHYGFSASFLIGCSPLSAGKILPGKGKAYLWPRMAHRTAQLQMNSGKHLMRYLSVVGTALKLVHKSHALQQDADMSA